MSEFQKEMQEIVEKRKSLAQEGKKEDLLLQHRLLADQYIDQLFHEFLNGFKVVARAGTINYNYVEKYSKRSGELISTVETDPHYFVFWRPEVDLLLGANEFRYDAKEEVFYCGETETLFYILDELEDRLKEENIVLIDRDKTERKGILHNQEELRSIPIRFRDHPDCQELRNRVNEYVSGKGNRFWKTSLGFTFAYFIKEL